LSERIRIEGVHGIVLCNDKYDVVSGAADLEIRNVERLRVHQPISREKSFLAEAG
jgi:hypothetical protein